MANEVTASVATEWVLSEMIAEYIYRGAYEQSKLGGYVHFETLEGVPTQVKEISKDPLIAAAALTEGTDLANTPCNPTSTSITAAEVGLMVTPTDFMLGAATVGLQHFVELMTAAIGVKVDTDIAANSATLGSYVGTTTADCTETNFLDAIYTVRNGTGRGPFFAALHPIQVRDLQVDLATSTGAIWGSSAGPDSVIAEMAMLYNVLVVETTVIPTANAGADRGGFLAPIGQECGIAIVLKRGARMESDRDISLRATELVGTIVYGTGVPDTAAKGGCAIITDA